MLLGHLTTTTTSVQSQVGTYADMTLDVARTINNNHNSGTALLSCALSQVSTNPNMTLDAARTFNHIHNECAVASRYRS